MSLLKQSRILNYSDNERKKSLIQTITFEFLLIGILLECIDIYLHFWSLGILIFIGIFITSANLLLLKKNYSIFLCGHILNAMALIIIAFANAMLDGLIPSTIGWFYVLPAIAAATIGLNGLIIYGVFSMSLMILFISNIFPPLFLVPNNYIIFLTNLNHLFIFLLIITILYNILSENQKYEILLREQNYLLHADKKKFHYLSHHDSLTNLPNRSYFNHYFQTIIESTNTRKNALTLYFMDLDGFKKINDKYGHEIGDILLLQTSKRLQSCFRDNDFIARLGGDEFTAIISHKLNDKIAEELTQCIEKEFMEPFVIKNLEIKCTISIGTANYPLDGLRTETLLKIADDAMYKNKQMKYRINAQN